VYVRPSKGEKDRWVEANELALQALTILGEQPRPKGGFAGRGTLVGYAPDWFTMIVHDAAKAAGLPPNRRKAHMLRASFATHLLARRVPISVVSRLLGHSDISTTSRYLSVNDVDRRSAVDRLTLPVG
jgi:integrase/recombinase XerD